MLSHQGQRLDASNVLHQLPLLHTGSGIKEFVHHYVVHGLPGISIPESWGEEVERAYVERILELHEEGIDPGSQGLFAPCEGVHRFSCMQSSLDEKICEFAKEASCLWGEGVERLEALFDCMFYCGYLRRLYLEIKEMLGWSCTAEIPEYFYDANEGCSTTRLLDWADEVLAWVGQR